MAPHSPPHTLNPPPEATASSNRNTASPPAHTLSLSTASRSTASRSTASPHSPQRATASSPAMDRLTSSRTPTRSRNTPPLRMPPPRWGNRPSPSWLPACWGIFLGGLGVHNFYLGNTGKAVAQLLLTLVGWILLGLGPIAAAIWGFVEGIIILCSKPGSPWHKDANGYELSD